MEVFHQSSSFVKPDLVFNEVGGGKFTLLPSRCSRLADWLIFQQKTFKLFKNWLKIYKFTLLRKCSQYTSYLFSCIFFAFFLQFSLLFPCSFCRMVNVGSSRVWWDCCSDDPPPPTCYLFSCSFSPFSFSFSCFFALFLAFLQNGCVSVRGLLLG